MPRALDEPAGMAAAIPVPDDPGRSPDASVCPFFRREVDGALVAPAPEPDDANRCIAVGPPRQQSARQQELVCLRSAHADCPRYLRGAFVEPDPRTRRRIASVPRATLAALVILVLSAGISFGFVLQRGGIDLPAGQGSPASTAEAAIGTAAVPTVAPASPPPAAPGAATTAAPTAVPTPAPTAVDPTPVASTPTAAPATPTAAPATPTAVPTPTAAPTPVPSGTPAATPASDRYRLLKPCPDRKACWIYTIRGG